MIILPMVDNGGERGFPGVIYMYLEMAGDAISPSQVCLD